MSNQNQAQTNSFSGTVGEVFEDGFFLDTGDRILEVDTYDLFGDSTESNLSSGQTLTVFGEFDDDEFDADSITFGSGSGIGISDDDDDIFGNNRNNALRGTSGSDDIFGRGGNDRLIGLGGGDDLFGGNGNDTLVGGGGDDDLIGGNGRDLLRGGSGEDELVGGAGRDILIGNGGEDTFVLQRSGNDIIRDFRDEIDEFELSGGLRFNQLDIRQQGNNTLILNDGNRVALLVGVDANVITRADFD